MKPSRDQHRLATAITDPDPNGARAPTPVLVLPNQPWSLDFLHDQMASGRRFRVLNVVDDVNEHQMCGLSSGPRAASLPRLQSAARRRATLLLKIQSNDFKSPGELLIRDAVRRHHVDSVAQGAQQQVVFSAELHQAGLCFR